METSDEGYTIKVSGSGYDPSNPCEQHGDNTFDHLADYNSMMAKGTCKDGEITAPLQFSSMMSMLSFQVTMPEGERPTKLYLISEEQTFQFTEGYHYQTDDSYTGRASSNMSVSLSDINASTFTANMLIIPTDNLKGSGYTIQIVVISANNEVFASSKFNCINYLQGKRHIKTVTVEKPLEGEGTASNPWLIASANDLMNVSLFAWRETDDKRLHFKLEKDIDLNDLSINYIITPGNMTFDGNNKCISGYTGSFGLFYALTGTELKDLTVKGEMISRITCGGFANSMDDVTLSGHIVSDVKITPPEGSSNGGTVGGIIGSATNVRVSEGTVLENRGDLAGTCVGGLFGKVSGITFPADYTLINTGTITGKSSTVTYAYAGGFFGSFTLENSTLPTFLDKCRSEGAVAAEAQGTRNLQGPWVGWRAGTVMRAYNQVDEEATQQINTGYQDTPTLTATNPAGGPTYVNGVLQD